MTHAATVFVAAAFFFIAHDAGSQEFARMSAAGGAMSRTAASVAFLFAAAGFGTKAGLVPLHIWLPRAHPVAPSHVSALMSGAMVNTGLYGIMRVSLDFLGPGEEWWGVVLIVVGSVSAVLGILYAVTEHEMKRVLAFSTIENMGIITVGIGVALTFQAHGLETLAAAALTAALLHLLSHSVIKGALFLAAGSVQRSAHTLDLDRLGGLSRRMPATAAVTLVASLAIVGLPPLSGFPGEWLLFRSLLALGQLDSGTIAPLAGLAALGAIALTGGLALACFVRLYGVAFLGLSRSPEAAQANEVSLSMRLPVFALGAAALLGGVAAPLVVHVVRPAARSLFAEPGVHIEAAHRLTAPAGGSLSLLAVAAVLGLAGTTAWLALRLLLRADGRGEGRRLGNGHAVPSDNAVHRDLILEAAPPLLFARPPSGTPGRDRIPRRLASAPPRALHGPSPGDVRRAHLPSRPQRRSLVRRPRPHRPERERPALPPLHRSYPRHTSGGDALTIVHGVVLGAIQVSALALIAPLFSGIVRKGKARLQQRAGPPLLQQYWDLRKWWSRGEQASATTSYVHSLAPFVVLGATVAALLLIPFVSAQAPLDAEGDIFVLIGLLAVARAALTMGAMDSGATFGQMGSSREVAVAALVEPLLILALAAPAVAAHSSRLPEIVAFGRAQGVSVLTLGWLLAAAAFLVVLVAETGRIPVDNPDTHLELTMIHEAMLIEYSGRRLGILHLAAMLKQILLALLFVNLFFPFGLSPDPQFADYALAAVLAGAKLLVVAGGLIAVEMLFAKMRFFELPGLLGTSILVAGAGVVATVVLA